jgi:hypothetical protein
LHSFTTNGVGTAAFGFWCVSTGQLAEHTLAEAVHDHRNGVLRLVAALPQVEQLIVADLRGGRASCSIRAVEFLTSMYGNVWAPDVPIDIHYQSERRCGEMLKATSKNCR